MSYERILDSSPGTLSRRERAILEYCAEGLNDQEIAIRLQVEAREISSIRRQGAAKLAARIGSSNPFRIHELVLADSLYEDDDL